MFTFCVITTFLITSIFNINSVQKIIKPCELFPIKRVVFFTHGSFTVQCKGQKLAGKILLT